MATIDYYDKFDQQIIVKAIIEYLQFDANIETRKRRQLRPNPIAPWELRIGRFRVFYELAERQTVKVLAVGHKEHNELFIRGRKVQI
jgi:mRNA-degrading endonuclease RelE of RelBE toxin-antitoxin system